MEILNILYNNNLIAVYLIGAILIIILIFIVISSINTTPKKEDKILEDPIEKEKSDNIEKPIVEAPVKDFDLPKENKINDMVDNIYKKVQNEEQLKEVKPEAKNLNEFLQEFDVPKGVIDDVIKEEDQVNQENTQDLSLEETSEEVKLEEVIPEIEEKELDLPIEQSLNLENPEFVEETIETPKLKEEKTSENIESMLKRLYDLRQNEKDNRKNALINEIIDLKKELDEALKAKGNNYELNHHNIDSKELADYYLFNKDIEFPKLK